MACHTTPVVNKQDLKSMVSDAFASEEQPGRLPFMLKIFFRAGYKSAAHLETAVSGGSIEQDQAGMMSALNELVDHSTQDDALGPVTAPEIKVLFKLIKRQLAGFDGTTPSGSGGSGSSGPQKGPRVPLVHEGWSPT